jgi:hypothetical protein
MLGMEIEVGRWAAYMTLGIGHAGVFIGEVKGVVPVRVGDGSCEKSQGEYGEHDRYRERGIGCN